MLQEADSQVQSTGLSAQDPWDEQGGWGGGFCEVGLSEAAAISPCVPGARMALHVPVPGCGQAQVRGLWAAGTALEEPEKQRLSTSNTGPAAWAEGPSFRRALERGSESTTLRSGLSESHYLLCASRFTWLGAVVTGYTEKKTGD